MKKPVTLIIMDGYGLSDSNKGNAISMAKKPNLDQLFKKYPNNILEASGLAVGLPEGQMGNSEVGHLNIGAGRTVYQSLTRINVAINDGSFFTNEAFLHACDHVKKNNSKLHIFALASDGGVHSHTSHIIALLKMAKMQNIKEVYVHAFLDGRDVAPDSAKIYLEKIMEHGKIATVSGRYYAMDRDKNWNRIQVAYDNMIKGNNEPIDVFEGLAKSYEEGIYDEFVKPYLCDKSGLIADNDAIIFSNFRPDRAIQISTAFSNPEVIKPGNPIVKENTVGLDATNAPKNIFFVSMMSYASSVKGEIAFGLQDLKNTLGDVLADNNMKQLRIAETEKYAHVTFFFDGGVDKEIKGSKRVLVNSPKVATYDLKPEMSAYEVTEKVIEEINNDTPDAIILNFANCDMVGHTGVIDAAVKAVEAVDTCVGKVYEAVKAKGGVCIITADHGNAEKLLDAEGNPFTAHTTNVVPVVITDNNITVNKGILADIAPTMLQYLNIKQPKEMTGKSLINEK